MNILLIEDDSDKKNNIEVEIRRYLSGKRFHINIFNVTNLADTRRELLQKQYDLVIFDMFLPDIPGENSERDCSEDLIVEFSKSKNYKSEAIALTQFESSELENMQSFNLAGITVVKYDSSRNWVTALEQKLERAAQRVKFDFLIFCALSKERDAYNETDAKIGDFQKISGMDCQEITIDSYSGLIIKPRSMGLVNMAVVSSKAIELFQPKIVAMSGICAGIEGESDYLDIISASICWEYQTGKWKDGMFKQEPYQVDIDRDFQIDLEHISSNSELLDKLRVGRYHSELQSMKIHIAPISSGSAVIADAQMMERIAGQHRKMAGLEMEMYSMFESAAQSLCRPLYFGAKTVVDMGSVSKGDSFHETGCIMSARYVVHILRSKLVGLN